MTPTTLDELECDLARDLRLVAYPANAWVPPRQHAGEPVLDVLIVGAGQGGLAVASLLLRERVDNILVVDEAPDGDEGIWMRFARMQTLRTPKFIGGPDLGLPSLGFQAWFEAQHGAPAFDRIKYIAKGDWQAYLAWFRRVLKIPVRNDTRFCGVEPAGGGLLRATLSHAGTPQSVLVRKLVLAAGIESSGFWWMPDTIAALPDAFRAHASEAIDFEALRGKRVAVIGAGASAFDNAATALEAGAAHVRIFCRRAELQRVQPYKVLAYPGFLRHFGALDDATRWRLMNHLLTIREALTRETWERVTCHANFDLMTGAAIVGAEVVESGSESGSITGSGPVTGSGSGSGSGSDPGSGSGTGGAAVRLHTPRGAFEADHVICGTGFEVDLHARPELRTIADAAATWSDRWPAAAASASGRLGRYPYLDDGFAFTEREPGRAPWLRDVHCFNFGATLSFGPSGSSISAMKFAVPRLVHAVTRDLFIDDIEHHARQLLSYDTPEFDLVYARDAAPAAAPAT